MTNPHTKSSLYTSLHETLQVTFPQDENEEIEEYKMQPNLKDGRPEPGKTNESRETSKLITRTWLNFVSKNHKLSSTKRETSTILILKYIHLKMVSYDVLKETVTKGKYKLE